MKKYLVFICTLALALALVLTGCKNDNPDANDQNEPVAADNIIFGGDFKIIVPEGFDFEEQSELVEDIKLVTWELRGSVASIIKDTSDKAGNEILIGKTNRELSTQAYKRLDLYMGTSEGYVGYLVYSDGESIAIAYDSQESLEMAIEDFASAYLSAKYGKATVDAGTLLKWKYNLEDLYNERDAVIMAERWKSLEQEINSKGYDGKATVSALKGLYSLYSDEIYMWMANLYEPEVPCTCIGECAFGGDHGGGFYYSNSGRDTVGFLPDIESTYQILNYITLNGMVSDSELPKDFVKDIVQFVRTCQSSADGYFYHPQWAGLVTTDERRGRDYSWATEIFKRFGEQPLYSTGGLEGTLGDPGVSATSHLVSPIRRDKSEISRVVALANVTIDYLKSEAAFKEYLDSQDWTDAYTTGNRLAAQNKSIKDAGLLPFLIDYLNAKQRPNGMFDDQTGAEATNGFLKIGSLYQKAGVVIPHSKEAAEYCIELLLSEAEPDRTVCWTYNLWFALGIITDLLDKSDSEIDSALADEIRHTLRTNAPEYIAMTAKKYTAFLKNDGTFSFTPDQTSSSSQGMPVAVPGTNEGDVNATAISSSGVPGYIFQVLGYTEVKLHTENDYNLFINRIEELQAVIKTNNSASGGIDFEEDDINKVFHDTDNVAFDITPDIFESAGIDPTSGYAVITNDDDVAGKVLEYGKPNAGATSRIEFANRAIDRTRFVYEFDMKFMGGDFGKNGHTRFSMYYNGKRFYSIYAFTIEGGKLALGSYDTPLAVMEPNEWYTLRFEYYADTPDKACKIFINGEYICEGGTSDPSDGKQGLSRAFVEFQNGATGVAYRFDNVLVSSDDEPYTPPSVEAGDSVGSHYQDAEYKGTRYDYDNESTSMPELFNKLGALSVVDGRLKFDLKSAGGEDAVIYNLPISIAQSKYPNLCKIFEFEFSYSGVGGEKPLSVMLGNQEYPLVKDSETGKLNIVDPYNENKVINTNLEADRVYVLRFECYAYAEGGSYNLTKVYVDESYTGQLRSNYNSSITKLMLLMDASLAGTEAYVTLENVLLSNVDKAYEKDPSEPAIENERVENVTPSPTEGGSFYQGITDGSRFTYDAPATDLQTDGVNWDSDDSAKFINSVLLYTRNSLNRTSYMRWNSVKPSDLRNPVFIFETDFKFDGFKGNSPQQRIMLQANGISHMIVPTFNEVDGVQTMTIGKITVTEGQWANIRFEIDYAAGAVCYFLNDTFAGYEPLAKSDTTYSRVLWYYLEDQSGGSMSFDNTFISFLKKGSFCQTHIDENSDGTCDNCPLDMPKPVVEIPENTVGGGDFYNGEGEGNRFDCSAPNGNLKTDGVGASDMAVYQNGQLVFTRYNNTGSGESYIRWNHAANTSLVTPVFIFETDFYFKDFNTSAATFQKIIIEANGIKHQILPTLSADKTALTIGKLTLSADKWHNIRFELDYKAGEIYYFLDGEYQGLDKLDKTATSNTRVLWYYMAKQTAGSMAFDNTFEGLVEDGNICDTHIDENGDGKCDACPLDIPEPPKPEIVIPDNTVNGGTFYKGDSAGNRFTYDSANGNLKTDGVIPSDEVTYKNGKLLFIRNGNIDSGSSYLRWNFTAGTAKLFVFETDLYFRDFAQAEQISNLRFMVAGNFEYKLSPKISADGKTMTIGKLVLSADNWHNIRFEIEIETGRINYFLNGEFKGFEVIGRSTSSYGNRVLWYYTNAQTAGITVFDNTFMGFAESGTSVTCSEHTDADSNNVCDICGGAVTAAPPETDPDIPETPDTDVGSGSLGSKDELEDTDGGGWIEN